MRHRKRRSRLSMMTAHRQAMLRNTVQNLFKYQRIETTLARAKETRRLAEKLITISKDDTVTARRRVYASLPDRDLVKKLFTEITPLFKDRTSGYTRIIATRYRRGDGASLALLELTEQKAVEKHPKKAKAADRKAAAPKAEKPKDTKKESHDKAVSGEKARETDVKRAKKAEDQRIAEQKGLMKNLRGFFKRKTDT